MYADAGKRVAYKQIKCIFHDSEMALTLHELKKTGGWKAWTH